MIQFDTPWLLGLLPLALLPLWSRAEQPVVNAWVALMPRDRASDALRRALQAAAVLALALLVLAMAGPHRPEYTVERVGTGAEIVVVLDRSRSMDQGFAGARLASGANRPRGTGPEAIDYYMSLAPGRPRDAKGKVARRMLSEFASSRPDDRFGMVVFSTLPMRVLEFTQKNEVVQAAIAAGEIGRGLSETNIGLALLEALSFFDERPYTGSRIVMLVSDGGDHLDPGTQERIAYAARKHRAAIDWFYLRSANSPGLNAEAGDPLGAADTVPEHQLHRFFQSLGTPYRAYEADNDKALQAAIDDVNRLENLPITYLDLVPRRDLAPYAHGAALLCVLLLLAARALEIRRWA
ncbi:MAG TPA: vWA domain-containing protein [Rhizobacter sp.]|nr:vWA domain-containing protein [Rhizobacter sp.]